jgi:hypothetical protein
MMNLVQTSRLIPWTVGGLIALAILLHFFGPAELETDELVVIALIIIALMGFRIWLHRKE